VCFRGSSSLVSLEGCAILTFFVGIGAALIGFGGGVLGRGGFGIAFYPTKSYRFQKQMSMHALVFWKKHFSLVPKSNLGTRWEKGTGTATGVISDSPIPFGLPFQGLLLGGTFSQGVALGWGWVAPLGLGKEGTVARACDGYLGGGADDGL
jgi:hypothetical protein